MKKNRGVSSDDDISMSEHFFASVQKCIGEVNQAISDTQHKLLGDFVPTCKALNSIIKDIRSVVNKDKLATDKLTTSNVIALLGLDRQQNGTEYEAFGIHELKTRISGHIKNLCQHRNKLGEWFQQLRKRLVNEKLLDHEIEPVRKECLEILAPLSELKFGCGEKSILYELYGGNCASIVRFVFLAHLHIENMTEKSKFKCLIESLSRATNAEEAWDRIKEQGN